MVTHKKGHQLSVIVTIVIAISITKSSVTLNEMRRHLHVLEFSSRDPETILKKDTIMPTFGT